MKIKLFFLAVIVITNCCFQMANAQDCKFLVDQFDSYSKKLTRGNSVKIFEKLREEEYFVLYKEDSSYSFVFFRMDGNRRLDDPVMLTFIPGKNIYITFVDDSMITLKNTLTFTSAQPTDVNLNAIIKKEREYFTAKLPITSETIKILSNKKIAKIHLEVSGTHVVSNKSLQSIDVLVSDEIASLIMANAKCISK